MFLLDTNVCVVYMRGKNALVRARVSACPIADLYLCAPVEAELRFGALNGKSPVSKTQKVEAFLTPYPKLAFDDAASQEYARFVSISPAAGYSSLKWTCSSPPSP